MNVALASLDRGVRALFTPGNAFTGSSPHPLCECILHQARPPDWQYLHRYPVLKRHVLRQFRSLALEMEKIPQTPQKRKKRSTHQQNSDLIEYKTLCLASLCQKLAQCELLTLNDAELMKTLVSLESLEVLRRVVTKRLLPLRLRLLLSGWTLQSQQEKCVDAAVQSWILQVCEKLVEEVLEATATRGSSEPLSKRTKTTSGDMRVVRGKENKGKCCGFCRGKAISAEALRSNLGWEFLVECTQQTAQVLEKAGESYATNQAMVALSAFWESLPVAGLKASVKIGRRKKRCQIPVTIEEDADLSMTVAAYEEICRNAVGSSAGKTNAFQIMWTSVWNREFKYMAQMKLVTLADAVRHCLTVDAFASMVLLTEAKEQVTHLPGFCAVMEVIHSLFAGTSEIITAFAHVWDSTGNGGNDAFSHVTIPTKMGLSSVKRMLQSYLSELMKYPSARDVVASPSVNKAPAPRRMLPLKLIFVLYQIFSPVPDEQQDGSCFRHWDALMTWINSDTLVNAFAQDGITWCLFLEKCVLGVGAEASLTMCCGNNFLRAFQRYCHAIMYAIIVTGGEVISSGGTIRRLLIREESDRAAIRQVLVQMMTTFGEDWITEIIVQLLRVNASLCSKGEFNPRGMKTLFFPALVSCMKSSNRTNLREQKTGQQRFAAFVHSASVILNESETSPLCLVSLIRFCEAWDVYQSSHTKEAPTIANRWGLRAMIELDVLPELLECYSRNEVIHQETSEALLFAAEVLQNTSKCPLTLEASLFEVLSAVKAGAEQGTSTASNVLAVMDQVLVSHSSDVLQRLLRAVRFAGVTQTRQLMSQIKDIAGTLGELRNQLERWFSFVEMNGTAFAGKETRLELSLLCTRLIRWFPNEFEKMRFLLMTPLDSRFVFALEAFVKEAGRPNHKVCQSVLSSTSRPSRHSAVRVEMALHSYLSAAVFPDLETLTVLLAKAIIKCRSPDAYYHLTTVAKKNSRMLLPETAVATLSSPLRGLEFSTSGLDNGDDDELFKNHARRAKSIIYQENTLKLLAASSSIFAGGLPWSTMLFGERSAVIWLPHLFEYVLKTDFCEGILRADRLFECLDNLIRTAKLGENAFQEAYWLAALLNTALVACSSRSAGACADLEEDTPNRLRQIAGNVMQLLSFRRSSTQMIYDKSDAAVQSVGILSLQNSLKCARLVVKEDSAGWSCERFVGEKAGNALRMIVSAAWDAEMKTSQATEMQPSMQLFVPFSHWLSGALVYSQSFLEELSALMRRWERTFTSYVTDLYLHLEFEDVTCDLLQAWLTTWITSNIARGQDETQLLALLPSQVALFRRLSLTPYHGSSRGQTQDSTSIWQLVFVSVNLAVETPGNSAAMEQATELVVSTLTTLELVELSSSSDFVPFRQVQDIEPFFQELENFLSRPQLRFCGVAQVCCLLQYPLELLVCCYTCKIPAEKVSESQLFLQRLEVVLQENFGVSKIEDFRVDTKESTESTLQESPRAKNESNVETTLYQLVEIEAFFQHWKEEMCIKYDYLDRERCAAVLKIIQAAMVYRTK